MRSRSWRGIPAALALAFSFSFTPVTPVLAQVELDLRDADLRSFITIVADATGRNFVLDPQVRGTVTVLAPQGMSPDALYEVFLNVLELNRLTIVQGQDADRIVSLNTARELAPNTGGVQLDGSYETRVIQLDHAPAAEVLEVIRPLLPSEAIITLVPRSNMLVLSDRGENFRRIENLVKRLDTPQERPIQMIRLRNANAQDVLQVVQSLNIIPADASISVDRRSNALVVSGPQELVEQVRVLSSRLDTQQNNVVSIVEQLNYADAAALADVVLRSFSGRSEEGATQGQISIVPEPSSNSLLISAPQDKVSQIVQMVRHLDRRPKQVLVEAVIFEMAVDGFSDLSVQFGEVLGDVLVGGVQFALEGRPTLTSYVTSVLNNDRSLPGNGGSIGGVDVGNGFGAFLTAIASTNSTRLLSTPSILTLNNQEAEIVVAQNVPFVTGSFATVGDSAIPDQPFQTIEREDIGLTLAVKPQVNADRTVRLDIKQEVSNLTNDAASTGGEITARRALSTTVLVNDGNVIMLGGLLENGSGSVTQKVPGLGDLPVLGGLFRGKNASRNQRVLLVLLRPRVIANDAEARKLTREAARDARKASLALAPKDGHIYPRTDGGAFPFDGADLNQPFDAGFIDDAAQSRNYPPLPSRLRFKGKY